jgi:hypothetical protein
VSRQAVILVDNGKRTLQIAYQYDGVLILQDDSVFTISGKEYCGTRYLDTPSENEMNLIRVLLLLEGIEPWPGAIENRACTS